MTVKVGISGFGRIGRCTLRTSLLQPEIEITAINNRSVGPIMADLLKFDTVHGTWDHDVSYDEANDYLIIDGRRIPVTNHTDPADIPWQTLGVDVVVESTGKFKDRESASKHLAGGAKRVIITAPGKNPDATIVMGVNEETYDPDSHFIISNGSCRPEDCFQCIVHDELPGTGSEGIVPGIWHCPRDDDDCPRIYE